MKTEPHPTVLSLPVTFDVSDRAGLSGSLVLAGRCFLPRTAYDTPPAVWCWLGHGATYTWRYWDLPVPGQAEDAYSFARYLARHGIGVVAIDHPGCGESEWWQKPEQPGDGRLLKVPVVAALEHEATCALRSRLQTGQLFADLPPVQELFLLGCGHSMGGGIAIVQQGYYASFQALALLGITCDAKTLTPLIEPVLERVADSAPGYLHHMRRLPQTQDLFYLPDVPAEVRKADASFESKVPIGTLKDLFLPGYLAEYASHIRCPVFLGFGERDLASDPRRELLYYGMEDCTVYELLQSAHCHNFASSRQDLWRTLYAWLWSIARSSQGIDLRNVA